MLLKIIVEPNEILHRKGAEIKIDEIKTPEFQQFVDDMIETMYKKDGVGLAGPQVGVSKQITVITKEYSHSPLSKGKTQEGLPKEEDLVLINPTWEKLSRWKAWDEEGCLSVPGVYGQVKRYKKIKVNALNRHGEPIEFIAEGFFARICQHEIDHLNGILFIEKARDTKTLEQ